MWNAATGQPVSEPLVGHRGSVRSVAFSPDGARIASGSDDETIRVWDAATGQPFGEPLAGHRGSVRSVAFSPDGMCIAWGSDDKTIRLDRRAQPAAHYHIGENALIKQVFFSPPGPNASTKKSGGKTKVSARWEICLKLLGDHPNYQEAIGTAANVPRERSPWANRIKNRLRTMGKETRAYIEIMGQTGARIECAADIDTTKENSFTTKWRTYSPYNSRTVLSPFTEEIEHECPWFFEMRELIGQRPNVVPVGLGHSSIGFDEDVMNPAATRSDSLAEPVSDVDQGIENEEDELTRSQIDDTIDSDAFVRQAYEFGSCDDEHLPSLHGDDESTEPFGQLDDDDALDDTKAPAQKSKPTPAPVVTPKPSNNSKLTEFADIAKNEETLELKSQVNEKRAERRHEEKQAKREERRERLKLKEMKLQHQHELRMARLGNVASGSSHTHAATVFNDPAGFASSDYAPSESDSFFGGITTGLHLQDPIPSSVTTYLFFTVRTTHSEFLSPLYLFP
ncbi:hypothetical protein B0H14DRAFT_3427117 [Mycena olivaceomarginata]|nr:hypothetical protein B0H14DRAFT_3427117 [Mycena olivaceomarginata]